MAIWYIDPTQNHPSPDGRSPQTAWPHVSGLTPAPGDTVLFRRGCIFRAMFPTFAGAAGAPITYGAYGEGDRPTFSGSLDVSSPECWEATERENVWRCIADIPTDVGNFVFNDEECTAALIHKNL